MRDRVIVLVGAVLWWIALIVATRHGTPLPGILGWAA